MKLFSLRNMVGLAAIYGVTQYARKQGGFRPMLEGLLNKTRTATEIEPGDTASSPASSSPEIEEKIEETIGYTGSSGTSDYGDDSPTRRT